MKKIEKVFYYLRMIFFVISLVLTFMLIKNITQVGLVGYLYLIIFILFSILIIRQVLSQKMNYKRDLVYNIMQIGYTLYLGVIVFKTYYDKIVVMDNTIKYFNLNYLILSILLIIIKFYKICDIKTSK